MALAGGWVMVLTFSAGLLFFNRVGDSQIWKVLGASSVVFFFGVLDDRAGLPPFTKLIGQGIAAAVLILAGVQVQLFSPACDWINITLTFLWVVGITNAYNFVDSMDGLAVGLASIASAFFMLGMQEAGQPEMSVASALILGACLGLYFYNSMPAKFFLGDSGSQWLGFMLASLAIIYTPQGFLRSQSWFVPILLLGIPIFDMALILVSRLRRGLPWFRANFDHTYHRLIGLGIHPQRAVVSMHLASLLLGFLAFILLSQQPWLANTIFGFCLILGGAVILWLDDPGRWPSLEKP